MAETEFAREPLQDAIPEVLDMVLAHYLEVNTSGLDMEPAIERYLSADKLGLIHLYTARQHGELVGYSLFLIAEHQHHAGLLTATQDLVYVRPDKRGFGHRFIAWCDEQLRDAGVGMVRRGISPRADWGKILMRMGYYQSEIVYAKIIT